LSETINIRTHGELTEPICQKIAPSLASMTIFDTSGIEVRVRENPPQIFKYDDSPAKTFKKA
jgi:hypothetical protein